MQINPYLNFDGDCAEAFRFYEQVLGGTAEIQTMGDSPMRDQTPPEHHGRVMHALLRVGEGALMASDSQPGRHQGPGSSYVNVNVATAEEGERIFAQLTEGGRVVMPFAPSFWAPGFGMLTDRYGINWMVNAGMQT